LSLSTCLRKGQGPIVAFRGVGKVYSPTPYWARFLARTVIRNPIVALNEVSIDLAPGELCAVVGPNGAGKTTLFRILVGLTTPTSGSATVLGLDVDRDSQAVRAMTGWMPADDRSLFLRLSCRENLYFHGRMHGLDSAWLRPRIDSTLEQVGLASAADNAAFSLSSGMRARLLLARALLHQPRVLILDEPTGALDPVAAYAMLELLREIVAEERLAALISSHRLEEIEALGNQVVLLDRGHVRYHGSLEHLRGQVDHPRVGLRLATANATAHVRELLGSIIVETSPDGLLWCTLPAGQTVGHLLSELGPWAAQLTWIAEQPLPLRDLLARLYGDEFLTTVEAPR